MLLSTHNIPVGFYDELTKLSINYLHILVVVQIPRYVGVSDVLDIFRGGRSKVSCDVRKAVSGISYKLGHQPVQPWHKENMENEGIDIS